MRGSRVIVSHLRCVRGGTLILDDISLTVEPGELIALTGPSGSGKTTLLQLIGSLDRPSSGTIMVDDVPVHSLRHPARFRRDTVGFVFQLHYLLPSLTVQQNVELTLVAARVRRRERAQRALALLDEVGLASRRRDLPAALSGGERQRVAIARALAGHASLVLADEPTGSLDSHASQRIWDLLTRVRVNHGSTIIVASHDPSLLHHADRGIALLDGRVDASVDCPAKEAA